jgi:hypothetical protein
MEISADAVATEAVDLLQAYKHGGAVTVLSVVVEQTGAADTDWNIELDGNDLFAAEQSVGAADTPEEFIPDQNREAHDDTAVPLALDVSGAGTGGTELNVSILWDDGT